MTGEQSKRLLCDRCKRPQVACICAFCTPISNATKVVLLQHPKEQGRSKGTADLLRLSLTDCQIIVGEDFSKNAEFNQLLAENPDGVFLLYPAEHASTLSNKALPSAVKSNPKVLMLIDATWKKAFKMYSLSANLQNLPCVMLPEGIEGRYRIRKTSKKAGLSTLEAACYALASIEQNEMDYKKLLECFEKFNDFQLSFRPQSHLYK